MIELKLYQEEAVDDLKRKVDRLLTYSESKVCVFKAPTGSGKTLMTAEFLRRLVTAREDDVHLSFIWISVNKLHDQSREKLEKYFEETRAMKCSCFDDLDNKRIGENEVLFFNWQSINKKDNVYIRENEQDNNLTSVVANTRAEGREIILIIDESHHTAESEKSRELIEAISPKVTLEVSATPQIKDISEIVEVDFQKVKAEGMIKSEIAINPEIDKGKVESKSTDEFVIECALQKRRELKKLLQEEQSPVNPLVLIQLPDSKKGVIDRKDDIIELLQRKFHITQDNRKLAIYLSDKDNKVNLENIEKPDNEIEVLIFKQAIALGWDCPRASILVLFRDWQSVVFSIQTIGRIMRMPEFRYYQNPELNKGYVFTNLSKVEIAEDIAKDYITVYESKRRSDLYAHIDLNSIYIKRQRARTRLTGLFSKIFAEEAERRNLQKKLTLKPQQLVNELLVDGRIVKLDKPQIIKSDKDIEIKITEKELQYRFDLFIRSVCSPFAPADSSGRIKTAIYKFFQKYLKQEDERIVQWCVLGHENNQFFIDSVNAAKDVYSKKIVEELEETREVQHMVWNVPLLTPYTSRYRERDYRKSILHPYYVLNESKPEVEFIRLLEDTHNKIKWWYKNGEGEPKYFAIKYTDDEGQDRSFYPDFIVMMNDGSIGIFDTKDGFTAKAAKEKAEALAHYIEDQNKRNKKNLWGGIVVYRGGSYRYNDSAQYAFSEDVLTEDWKYLTFK